MTTNNTTHSETPIETAGAAPAGLAAAITLAHAGRQVVVHETHKEVGHRFGGDFQGLENWTTEKDVLKVLESLGLTTGFITMPGRNDTVFDPARNAYEIKSDEPLFRCVDSLCASCDCSPQPTSDVDEILLNSIGGYVYV